MWIEWFVRCSTTIAKWPLRIVCDECKRHRYKLSFSSLLFINTRKIDSIRSNDIERKHYRYDERHYHRDDERKRSTGATSSLVSALTSAAMVFSWDNDGIDNDEL
jgi:hypothetical protein